jgi:hypothetical protein
MVAMMLPLSRSNLSLTVGTWHMLQLPVGELSVMRSARGGRGPPLYVRPAVQQWRARLIGPALVPAAVGWDMGGRFYAFNITLPLPGRYELELLLEHDSLFLRSSCPSSSELKACFTGGLGGTGCKHAGEAGGAAYADCMQACNDKCGAPSLQHEAIPLRHHTIMGTLHPEAGQAGVSTGLLSRGRRSRPCEARAALGAGVWVDKDAACADPATLKEFGSLLACHDAVMDCSAVRVDTTSASAGAEATDPQPGAGRRDVNTGTRTTGTNSSTAAANAAATAAGSNFIRGMCAARWVWRPLDCALRAGVNVNVSVWM